MTEHAPPFLNGKSSAILKGRDRTTENRIMRILNNPEILGIVLPTKWPIFTDKNP
jgi:hypothetical protein